MKNQSLFIRFYQFPVGIYSDSLCSKGVLFARIKLPQGYLNLFNTHLQASYDNNNLLAEIPSYLVRLKSVIQLINFVQKKKSIYKDCKDLTLLMGDFNVNSRVKDFPMEMVLEHINNPDFNIPNVGDKALNEYDLLMFLLNNKKHSLEFCDLGLERHGEFKVTYGDVHEIHGHSKVF